MTFLSPQTQLTLRVAMNRIPGLSLDPARINTRTQYNILRALYLPLFYQNDQGENIPILVSHHEWSGCKLSIQLKHHLTSHGKVLTAEDVLFNFSRLMALGKNTHGNLQEFLCPQHLVSFGAPITGMEGQGNEIVFTLIQENLKPFFVQLLANMDYAIVPMSAFDPNDPLGPIRDFTHTTAFYTLKNQSEEKVILERNPSYENFPQGAADSVEILNSDDQQAIEWLVQDKIDVIHNILHVSKSKAEELGKNYSVHETFPIQACMLTFTQKGLGRFSIEERIFLAQILKKRVREFFSELNDQTQFFPKGGRVGVLNENQAQGYQEFLRQGKPVHGHVEIETPSSAYAKYSSILNFEVEGLGSEINDNGLHFSLLVEEKGHHSVQAISDQRDLYFGALDGAFFEDLGALSYAIATGVFGTPHQKSDLEWLDLYRRTSSLQERLEKLRAFHFEVLTRGVFFPIGYTPYRTISRRPWVVHFPRHYASGPLWDIRYEG